MRTNGMNINKYIGMTHYVNYKNTEQALNNTINTQSNKVIISQFRLFRWTMQFQLMVIKEFFLLMTNKKIGTKNQHDQVINIYFTSTSFYSSNV
jgi:hypothetical protein